MSTANEIRLMIEQGEKLTQAITDALKPPLSVIYMLAQDGRKVHAQRARKLRSRGENVRYLKRTPTGKAVYVWLPKSPFILATPPGDGYNASTLPGEWMPGPSSQRQRGWTCGDVRWQTRKPFVVNP